jgi:hypothetical protein
LAQRLLQLRRGRHIQPTGDIHPEYVEAIRQRAREHGREPDRLGRRSRRATNSLLRTRAITQRRHTITSARNVGTRRARVITLITGLTALLGPAIANVTRAVMLDTVAALREIAITGCLILVGRSLIGIGGTLIAVRPGLVSIRERLIPISKRLFPFERTRNRKDALMLPLDRLVRGRNGTIARRSTSHHITSRRLGNESQRSPAPLRLTRAA